MSSNPALRFERLIDALDVAGVDALVVTELVNVRYLTGFTGSNATLVVRPGSQVLFTDRRYTGQASDETVKHGANVRLVVPQTRAEEAGLIQEALLGATRVGLEANRISWAQQRSFAESLVGVELVPTHGVVEEVRAVKDAGEIETISAAARIADDALAVVAGMITQRPTEREVAFALDAEMRRLGASDVGFMTIVAAGPNAAEAHHPPSERRIESGDAVIFDFGACVGGYRSDMSRTYFAGTASDEMRQAFEVVMESQAAGVAAVRAGVTCGQVSDACMDVLRSHGRQGQITHGIGHGIGLETHEDPMISSVPDRVLTSGNVITVEPGVYLPGIGGVRIEDTVAVTSGGCTILTAAPKRLVLD